MSYPENILQKFIEQFGKKPQLEVRAPGRINLIGEHTDYNDGFVLPASIDKAIYFAVSLRDDDVCEAYSENFDAYFSFKYAEIEKSEKSWANYLMGVVVQLQKKHSIKGFNVVFGGDIPAGGGMSSSAALSSGLLFALNQLNGLEVPKLELVEMAQKVENEFIGLNCGIMDMFASMMGKADSVIQLDCRNLEYFYFRFSLEEVSILLCNSGVKHSLADSAYNKRREECEEGVAVLKKRYPEIASLRNISMEELVQCQDIMPDNVFKRCRYVVSEIDRVLAACEDLERNDLETFGKKMFETHLGLRDDYEVSCEELDFLVEIAKDQKILGARLMGGGFGGCTINLIKKDAVESFTEYVKDTYLQRFNIELEVYEVQIVGGVGKSQ